MASATGVLPRPAGAGASYRQLPPAAFHPARSSSLHPNMGWRSAAITATPSSGSSIACSAVTRSRIASVSQTRERLITRYGTSYRSSASSSWLSEVRAGTRTAMSEYPAGRGCPSRPVISHRSACAR